MPNYKYIDHTADLGIEVWAKNYVELLVNIANAMFETAISGTVAPRSTLVIELQGSSREELFIDWCRELIYNFSVTKFIPCEYDISLKRNSLKAVLKGDIFDPRNHRIKIEIKNPTYHKFSLEKTGKGIRARIIFDV